MDLTKLHADLNRLLLRRGDLMTVRDDLDAELAQVVKSIHEQRSLIARLTPPAPAAPQAAVSGTIPAE